MLTLSVHVIGQAQESSLRDPISFNGFGSVGLAHSTSRDADFISSGLQSEGVGYSRRWSPDVDSRVGLQAVVHINERFEGTLQAVSQSRVDSGYSPRVEWANIKYQVNPQLAVRAGRIVLPAFMASDSRLVGFANTWLRPPVETYNLLPFTNSDGVDVLLKLRSGQVSHTLHAMYGHIKGTAIIGTPSGNLSGSGHLRNLIGIADEVSLGEWSARASAITGRFKLEDTPTNNSDFRLYNVGVSYERPQWFLQGEWSRLVFPFEGRNNDAFYIMAGRRFGVVTPYVLFSTVYPRDLVPGPTILDQRTTSIGVRWDFAKQTSLKIQADKIDVEAGSGGTGSFINAQPGFLVTPRTYVLSAVLDFVF